jgi:soluble lytic murein transglycosylase
LKKKITVFLICAAAALTLCFLYGIFERLSYPVKFKDEVRAAAAAFSVQENVVFAVIKIESGFNKDAVSSRGAVGLMQIMPSTGEYIYGKIYKNTGVFDGDMLFEPRANILFGTYYIRYLSDKFDGDPLWALAAYNAGEGNAAAWRNSGITVDEIPFKETREYIKKFQRAYKKYGKLNKN